MIDTTKIKNRWNNFEFGLVLDVDESTIFALFHDLKTLMKSHDELERKLKIAEDVITAMAKVNFHDGCDTCYSFSSNAEKALKQIRGE